MLTWQALPGEGTMTTGAQKRRPEREIRSGRRLLKDPGDNRLSHQRHYHRPGGLNGRVRNGNGCGPASMVAGKVAERRSSRPATDSEVGSHTKRHTCGVSE